MTKRRRPDTPEAALVRIAGSLPRGFEDMAEATNRPSHRIRAWADPDKRERLPIHDAILLDKACAAAGFGTPIAEFYLSRLDEAGALDHRSSEALARTAASVVRECGEAGAALFEAAQDSGNAALVSRARQEVLEALETMKRALPMLMGRDACERIFPTPEQHATGPPN